MTLLAVWLGVGAALMALGSQKSRSAGLPLGYFLAISLIHTPGYMVYFSEETRQPSEIWTRTGFEQFVIGMVAFLAGVIAARFGEPRPHGQSRRLDASELAALDRLALFYFGSGFLSYVAGEFLSGIPSITSILSAVGSLLIVGVCLRLWAARESGNDFKWWGTIALLPVLPISTLVKGGFLIAGAHWMLVIISFIFSQTKRSQLGFYLLAPFFVSLGLSVFVNYMAARTEYRRAVWFEQVGISERLNRVFDMFSNLEPLDLSNPKHRTAVDERLNQNLLEGLAAENLESGRVSYLSGSTIGDAALALIPRALWPDKPAVGGGGDIVARFTGLQFPGGTSVGAGQVLEFYANFGTWGVIGGFVLYGWLIGKMDLRVVDCLERGDQKAFLLWFLMGLAMLQPGNNLLEVVVTVASSAITASGLGVLLRRRFPQLMAPRPQE